MVHRSINLDGLAMQAGITLLDEEREPIAAVVTSIVAAFGSLELSDVPEDSAPDARWR